MSLRRCIVFALVIACDREADPQAAPRATTQAATLDQYVEADELTEEQRGTTLSVHGYVAPGSVMLNSSTGETRFRLVRRKAGIDVTYRETLPDRFQEKLEVIVKGKLASDGASIEASELVAKCPSDYESLPQWTPDAAP